MFFERNPTNCRERFFRDIVEVRGKGNDGISIIFAVRLPVVVEHFALMFVVVHAALFALLFLTGRRFERVRTEAALRISEITSQVAHDIRSPLAALQVALRSAEGWTSESKELVGSAASRIRSIAEDLLRLDRDRKLPPSVVSDLGPILSARSLDVVLRDLFEEKRREYIDRSGLSFFLELDSDFGSAVTNIEEHAFARMFSNLINNAVESISGVGRVVVAAKQTDKSVDIQIVDNGCGIPAELISTIGKTPFTRKSNGNGLGAVSAMRTVERWAGSITWQRNHSRGITVTISIPRVCSR
ncbi:MAG: hypothetical protein A2X94_02465 [Bdellovibrionales bacterium GWB1_55_8]|nr:MAG: hypothetical protein A2X94_02465 [Bdellovibrionales bacterium GWB1_55_8]